MVILTVNRVIVQEQVVAGIGQLPVQVVPDDDFGIRAAGEIVPEPLGIDSFRGQLALDPDTAVAGLLAQVPLAATTCSCTITRLTVRITILSPPVPSSRTSTSP